MLILGVDSSAKSASAAILNGTDGGKLLSEVNSGGNLSHSENLLPMIDCALKIAGVGINNIDLFAVASGPGSFTGIRIAVATIKGLAFGFHENNNENNIANCVSVSSLFALAHNFAGLDINKAIICPVIDARRRQVYNAVFTLKSGKPHYMTADRIITVDELIAELEQYDDMTIIFTGDAADICHDEINFAERKIKVIKSPEILKRPSGYAICTAALRKYNENGAISANALAPAYLIKTQAEREYE